MLPLTQWLAPLDALPLECDGLTRIISMLMRRDGIEHCVHSGSLEVVGVGKIPLHWWITLTDGQICDFRARMWLGESVLHGLFYPPPLHRYVTMAELGELEIALHPTVFTILAGKPMEEFSAFVN